MMAGAAMLVIAVRAIDKKYGAEGVEVIHKAFKDRAIELGGQKAERLQDSSLQGFCKDFEANFT